MAAVPVALFILCAVVLGFSSTAPASTNVAHVSLPVVPCPLSSSDLASLRGQHVPLPGPIPATVGVAVPPPAGTAVYGVRFPGSGSKVSYTVGPVGFACAPLYGSATGASFQSVDQAPGSGLGVSTVFEAGGIGPATDLVCAYIPAVLAADEVFRAGFGDGGCSRPGGDLVVQIPTSLANLYIAAVDVPTSVSDPNVPQNGAGKGIDAFALFTAQVFNGQSAAGQAIWCVLPPRNKSICIAALDFLDHPVECRAGDEQALS